MANEPKKRGRPKKIKIDEIAFQQALIEEHGKLHIAPGNTVNAVSVMDVEALKNLPEVQFTTTFTGSFEKRNKENQGINQLNQEQITPETVLKRAKWEDWQKKILDFCNKEGITPDELIEGYKKKKATLKDILGSTEQTTKNYMNERRQKKGLI